MTIITIQQNVFVKKLDLRVLKSNVFHNQVKTCLKLIIVP